MSILMTQTATIVYRVTYTRDEAVEILTAAGVEDDLANATDRDLGMLLAEVAKGGCSSTTALGVHERLIADAGDYDEVIDVDDWELTDVYANARRDA